MGVKLMKNFNHPYLARSISEFWRRWHISLSTWFRDYVYIPLGGNRVAKPRWAFNLFITFLISGLWHGANWTYILWGALHGSYLVLSILTEPFWNSLSALLRLDRLPRLKIAISTLTTFFLVTFAWIFFRAASLGDALYIVRHLASGWPAYLAQSWQVFQAAFQNTAQRGPYSIVNALFTILAPLTDESRTVIALTAFALVILIVMEVLQYRSNFLEQLHQKPVYLRRIVYASLLTVILIFGTSYASVQQAFIYFQF
jgi:D-alanyl-lipoteichoic acid acyltransferase DltB (MBOAT superfamily)